MSIASLWFDSAVSHFTDSKRNERAIVLFTKGLIVFSLFRVLTLWSVATIFFHSYKGPTPANVLSKAMLLPAVLMSENPAVILPILALALCILLFVKPNYLSNGILFWFCANLFVVKYPVTNGSDYLLLIMAFWNIGLSHFSFRSPVANVVDVGVFNASVLAAKLQVVIVYLISAWDKLSNDIWRSGDAIVYISNLETVFNPLLGRVAPGAVALCLAWLAILFELGFVFLIWKKRTRRWVLCVGVIFHLVIWIFLSLPDFSLLMIFSYIVFLQDEEVNRIKKWLKR